jgi:hypothetical protein
MTSESTQSELDAADATDAEDQLKDAVNYDDIADAPVTVGDDEIQSIAALAERQIILEDWIVAQGVRLKEAIANLKKISEEKLPEAMKAAGGMKKFTLENGFEIEVKEGVHGSITKANQEWCYKWLRDNNNGDLIKNEFKVTFGKGEDEFADGLSGYLLEAEQDFSQKEFIHPQTLGAFVRTEDSSTEVEHDAEWEKKFGVYRSKVASIARPKT